MEGLEFAVPFEVFKFANKVGMALQPVPAPRLLVVKMVRVTGLVLTNGGLLAPAQNGLASAFFRGVASKQVRGKDS